MEKPGNSHLYPIEKRTCNGERGHSFSKINWSLALKPSLKTVINPIEFEENEQDEELVASLGQETQEQRILLLMCLPFGFLER